MKKVFLMLLCLFLVPGFAFSEEDSLEVRDFYKTPDMNGEAVIVEGDYAYYKGKASIEKIGYCITKNLDDRVIMSMVFAFTPLEDTRKAGITGFLSIYAFQGEYELGMMNVSDAFYRQEEDKSSFMWTDPEKTDGFRIPYPIIYEPQKDVTYYTAASVELDNLADDVMFDLSFYGIEPFSVPIPEEVRLEFTPQ